MKPLIVSDAADHQIVDFLADRTSNQAAAFDNQRFACFARTVSHDSGEQENPINPVQRGCRVVEWKTARRCENLARTNRQTCKLVQHIQ
ncbi:hypothetical protein D3C84_993690 [compost metagenome]